MCVCVSGAAQQTAYRIIMHEMEQVGPLLSVSGLICVGSCSAGDAHPKQYYAQILSIRNFLVLLMNLVFYIRPMK